MSAKDQEPPTKQLKAEAQQTPAAVVHGAGTAWEHSHGPTGAKIVALGSITLGGATFIVDREGQVEAGLKTEFGVEHVGGAATKPSAAWIANPDGKKLCEPVIGEDHEPMPGEAPHWHFNLTPLYPVKKAKFVLQVGEEEAVVDLAHGAAPCSNGILSVFKAAHDPEWRGFLELTLHGDAGDLELRLYKSAGQRSAWLSHTGKPKPFDVPADTKIQISFPGKHEGKTVELAPRNMEKNEDEEGVPNMRDEAMTNYFIFPGESGQDPEWLKGLEWRGTAVVSFELPDGKSYACDPFVLVPHEVL